MARHDALLAGLGRRHRPAVRPRAARPAVSGGPLDSPGRPGDLGRVRPAEHGARAGRRPACYPRPGRVQHQLSGHRAGGRDRRGGDRPALPEPAVLPAGLVSGPARRAGQRHRRLGPAGQCRLQPPARLGCRGRTAPGLRVAAWPAVDAGGGRSGRRDGHHGAGPDGGAAADLGRGAAHRPGRGRQAGRIVGVRP